MNSLFIWTFSDFLLQFPKSEAEWIQIGSDFNERWQFPNCLGAVDGKHIRIRPPSGSGAYYYNYKQFHSIALMGIANSNYEFIMFDVGTNGRVSDGDVINNTCFYKALVEGQLKIPADRNLPGTNINVPHVLIGDEAFALKPTLMRPYPYRQSRGNKRKEEYNTRLCTARRVVENAFGILAQKWRIFHRPIETSVDTTIKIVRSTCILHNFIRTKNCDSLYFEYLDPVESTMDAFANLERDPRRATNMAFDIREKFADFFNK
nr:unnamed protein product [Callosobruchus analis]